MLRQEAALDRSIDRKVRILLRLRKESANLPIAPPSQDDGPGMENIREIIDSDLLSEHIQGVEAVEDSKLNEQHGNVYENKGPALRGPRPTGNTAENKVSYAQYGGTSLKTKGVIGSAEGRQVEDLLEPNGAKSAPVQHASHLDGFCRPALL
jgi:hypothetical protein